MAFNEENSMFFGGWESDFKFNVVNIIWLWDPSLFVWHGHKSPTTISVKKEFYKFTKYSTLIDESLNLMLNNLIKWKACFNPLVTLVATRGITTHVLPTKKSVATVDIWITFFIEVTFNRNKI